MDLREKITEALYEPPESQDGPFAGIAHRVALERAQHRADAVMKVVESDVAHWRAEAADAKKIMDRRGEHVKELKTNLAGALELHQPYTVTDHPMALCRTCDTIHPCATRNALEGTQ